MGVRRCVEGPGDTHAATDGIDPAEHVLELATRQRPIRRQQIHLPLPVPEEGVHRSPPEGEQRTVRGSAYPPGTRRLGPEGLGPPTGAS